MCSAFVAASPPGSSKVTDNTAHLAVVAHKEDIQGQRASAEQQPDFQSRPAFKDIVSQPPDGDSGMKVWLPKTVGKHTQRLLHLRHVRLAQIVEGGEETRTEDDGGSSHGLAFH